jgi:hypothetical protein
MLRNTCEKKMFEASGSTASTAWVRLVRRLRAASFST